MTYSEMVEELRKLADYADNARRQIYGPNCPRCQVPCVRPDPDSMEECPQCRWPFVEHDV